MAKSTSAVLEELRSLRSRLFEIDTDDDSEKEQLKDILDEYRDAEKYSDSQFDAFAEEYLITRFDIANLNDEIRPKVERLLIDDELSSIRNADITYWDRDRLMFCLMFDNEEIFTKAIKLLVEKNSDELTKLDGELSDSDESVDGNDVETLETWRDISLVKITVLRGLSLALDVLGSLNDSLNLSAIKLIYEFGHWKSLRSLLDTRNKMMWKCVKLVDFTTFLMRAHTYDKDFRETEDGQVDYGKCVDILFKHADYEVNEQNDEHYSALHLAVMYNKSKMIFHLLKNGAYIGMQDKNDRPAIWNIQGKILEKYFDQCIEGDDLIVFNFQNLIAPSEEYPNDMTAIEFISNSNDLKYLLEHPLVASFLFLKWNRLALIFYMDFMCYFLLSITTGCLSMYYLADPESYLIEMCMMIILFSVYVASRRTIQVIHCSSSYLRSWENYLNSLLTFLIVVFLVCFVISVPWNFHSPTCAAICILLITYEFFMMAGSFWHFSIYSEMFIVVAMNAIKSLQLYAIFLPAFSLLFYILLRDSSAKDGDGPNLNKFPTLGASIVKTIVMSVGEFDVINVNFDMNTISIYIFIGFLFLISTVFMNLLNGLAVSDTQKIQSKARLTSFRKRSQVLARYEEILTHQNHWFRDKYPKMWKILRFFTHINTFVYRDKRIYIELDDLNTVYAVKVTSNIICLRVPLRNWTRLRPARMSSKIIQNALEIRERYELEKHRNRKEFGENVQESIMNRITEIENTLKTMNETLRTITEKLIDK